MTKKDTYDALTLSIPNDSEYISIVRLMVSGVCSRMDYAVEDIEDIKIAISEACTNVVLHAYDSKQEDGLRVVVKRFDDKLELIIQDFGKGFDVEAVMKKELKDADISEDNIGLGLGLNFIHNLMDDVELNSKLNEGTFIRMIKYKKG